MAETIEQKAHRLLTEGRLIIDKVDGDLIEAKCRGFSDGEVYRLGFDPVRVDWHCSCEANDTFNRRCSHLVALQLVTVKPR